MGWRFSLEDLIDITSPNRDEIGLFTLYVAIPKNGPPSPRECYGAPIRVINLGLPNSGGGPDFANAKMWIGETLWAGAVELHLSVSSWHQHYD